MPVKQSKKLFNWIVKTTKLTVSLKVTHINIAELPILSVKLMQIRDRTATGLIPNQGCRYCEDNDIDRYKLNFDLQSYRTLM